MTWTVRIPRSRAAAIGLALSLAVATAMVTSLHAQPRAAAAGCDGTWSSSPLTIDPGDSIQSTAFDGPSEGWAVGMTPHLGGDVVLYWNGQAWNRTLDANFNRGGLYGVSVVDSTVFAVGTVVGGSGDQAFGETWAFGPGWAGKQLSTSGTASLSGVAGISPTEAWAVGSIGGTSPLIVHYTSGQWLIQPSPVGSGQLFGVTATAANDVWAVGVDGAGSQLILHWDGQAWHDASPGQPGILSSVSAAGANDIWAVGAVQSGSSTQGVVEHWDGTSWLRVDDPGSALAGLVGLTAVAAAPGSVWVVGNGGSGGPTSGLAEHWDGAGWTLDSPPSSSLLTTVVMLSRTDAWAFANVPPTPLNWCVSVTTPAAATGLSATNGSNSGSAQLSWTPPSSDGSAPITYYAVYAYSPTAPAQMLMTSAGSSFLATGLAPYNYYIFTITPYNLAGWGPWSAWSNWLWAT